MDDVRWNQVLAHARASVAKSARPVVLFRTPWERPDDGWSIAARAYARAMHMGGLDVRLVQLTQQVRAPEVDAEAGRFSEHPTAWDIHIFSSPLLSAEQMVHRFTNMVNFNQGPQVFHCVFERQHLEPALVAGLNQLHGVWAQCSANRDVLVSCGVENVTLIRFPYFDDDPHLSLSPPKKCRRFYWIGRFEPRKAPDNLLRAFMRAFKPSEATLTMKLSMYTHQPEYCSPESVVLDELARLNAQENGWTASNWRESIHLIRGRLLKAEMVNIHAANDVYVSTSRGEGLDLPAFAAKLAGRQLVLTDSGGPRDFINDGDVLIPAARLIDATQDYPTWGQGANYSDFDLEDVVAALRKVLGTTPTGSRVESEFRGEVIGNVFKAWVDALRSSA